jgi:hypothetical protein
MTSNFDLLTGSSDDKKIAAIKPVAAKARIVVQQPRIKWIWFSVIELRHQSESCANVFVLKCHCEPVLQARRLGTAGIAEFTSVTGARNTKPLTAPL